MDDWLKDLRNSLDLQYRCNHCGRVFDREEMQKHHIDMRAMKLLADVGLVEANDEEQSELELLAAQIRKSSEYQEYHGAGPAAQ